MRCGIQGALLLSFLALCRCAVRTYRDLTYSEMIAEIRSLAREYSDTLSVVDLAAEYNISVPWTCGDGPCEYLGLWARWPHDGPDPSRPVVFMSGALHGDERVGPVAVLETARVLGMQGRNGSALTGSWSAAAASPDAVGTGLRDNAWLLRLLQTRDFLLVPATNAVGYHRRVREEGAVDVNRDFPYARSDALCMRTTAARLLNEVWRALPVTVAVTYHAGMRAAAFTWGAPNHGPLAPDDAAQRALATAMATFGGVVGGGPLPVGPMNDVVYPVAGGMEDWAYAAGWENAAAGADPVQPCADQTDYPAARTQAYPAGTARAATILVETSDDKTPAAAAWGSDASLLTAAEGAPGAGQVPRAVRTALAAADMAAPYVQTVGLAACAAACGAPDSPIDPSLRRLAADAAAPRPAGGGTVPCGVDAAMAWDVGGARTVDTTQLRWAAWDALATDGSGSGDGGGGVRMPAACAAFAPGANPAADDRLCASAAARAADASTRGVAPRAEAWRVLQGGPQARACAAALAAQAAAFPSAEAWPHGGSSAAEAGRGRWWEGAGDLSTAPFRPRYAAQAPLPLFRRNPATGNFTTEAILFAAAAVDAGALLAPSGAEPRGVPPQTHLANARRNGSWSFTVGRREVRGQAAWMSPPLRVRVCPTGVVAIATLDGRLVAAGLADQSQCRGVLASPRAGGPGNLAAVVLLTTVAALMSALAAAICCIGYRALRERQDYQLLAVQGAAPADGDAPPQPRPGTVVRRVLVTRRAVGTPRGPGAEEVGRGHGDAGGRAGSGGGAGGDSDDGDDVEMVRI